MIKTGNISPLRGIGAMLLLCMMVSCKPNSNDPVEPVKPQDPPTWKVTTHVDPISSMTLVLGFDEALEPNVDTKADVVGVFAGEDCLAFGAPQMTEIGPRAYFRFQGPDNTLPNKLSVRYYSAQQRAYYTGMDMVSYYPDAAVGSTDEPFVPNWKKD